MIKHPHIMVFDSGAGGLSIAKAVLTQAGSAIRLSYFADRSAFPYGNKEETFLVQHVSKLIAEFVQQHQPDLIVIACNTASTIVLPELRSRFQCPFVGVVPAIKPAANLSVSRSIGVLATPATVSREYTSALIKEFAPDCKVHLYGSNALVRCAENFLNETALDEQVVRDELDKLLTQDKHIDTVVLACTHFPLIAHALKAAAPQINHWVDSSAAIARRTFHLLNELLVPQATGEAEHEIDIFFSTDELQDGSLETLQENYRNYLSGN